MPFLSSIEDGHFQMTVQNYYIFLTYARFMTKYLHICKKMRTFARNYNPKI